MSDLVERAKAALEGVTEGPWETRSDYMELTRVVHSGEAEFALFLCCDCGVEAGAGEGRDAEFIAAARTLVPELVAEVERLRQQLLLVHLYPCICTRHAITGETLDYDCGRKIGAS